MTARLAASFALLLLLAACERRSASENPGHAPPETAPRASTAEGAMPRPAEPPETVVWRFPDGPFGPTVVVTLVPARRDAHERFPVLVAFHGRGEALKPPERGARGWLEDYAIDRAIARLAHPPLVASDFLGFVTPERLAAHNQRLAARPFEGLIVVCPYLADVLRGPSAFEQGPALADFIVDRVLPRVIAETPAADRPAAVGVDGVSLGGRAALLVGLTRPEAFGSLGALQPAIDRSEVPRLTELATTARRKNPGLAFRLLTSDEDYFRSETEALAAAWKRAGIAPRLDVVIGPHDYAFNRGPGSYEMLLYHDAVLGGRAAPPPGTASAPVGPPR